MGFETFLRIGIDGTTSVSGGRVVQRSLDDIYNTAAKTTQKVDQVSTSLNKMGNSESVRTVKRNLDSASSSAGSFRDMLEQIEDRLIRVGASTVVFATIYKIIASIKQITSETLNYLGTIESATLGIGSSFLVNGKFIDTTTGKVLQGQQAMNASIAMSESVIEQLKAANLETIATLDQLIVAYQVTLPVAMARGFNKDQVMQFTLGMVQAAGAIGLSFDQMAEETRSLLTGTINPRTSRIATVLGLRNEDIAAYKGNAQGLFEFLMSKLEGFRLAGVASQSTWKGLWSNLKDILHQGSGIAFDGMFEGIKAQIQEIIKSIVTIDNQAKTITWNPEFVNSAKEIGESITLLFNRFVDGTKWLIEHRKEIGNLIAMYTAYKAAMTLASMVSTALTASTWAQTGAEQAKSLSIGEALALEKARLANNVQLAATELTKANLAAAVTAEEVLRANVLKEGLAAEIQVNAARIEGLAISVREAQANLVVNESRLALIRTNQEQTLNEATLNAIRLNSLTVRLQEQAQVAALSSTRSAEIAQTSDLIRLKAQQAAITNTYKASLVAEQNQLYATGAAERQLTAATTEYNAAIMRAATLGKEFSIACAQQTTALQSNLVAFGMAEAAAAKHAAAMTAASLQGRILTGVTAGLKTAMGLLGGEIGLIIIAIGSLTYAWQKLSHREEEYQRLREKRIANSPVNQMTQTLIEKEKELEKLKLEELQKTNPALAAKTAEEQRLSDVLRQQNSDLKEKARLEGLIAQERSKYQSGNLNELAGASSSNKLRQYNDELATVNKSLLQYGSVSKKLADVQKELDKRRQFVPNPPKPEEDSVGVKGQHELDMAYAAYLKAREDLEVAGYKARDKANIDSLKTAYDTNLITLTDYYEKKQAIDQAAIDREIKSNNEKLKGLQDAKILREEGTDPYVPHSANWYTTMTEIMETQTKSINLEERRNTIGVQAANDITEANKRLKESYSATEAEVLKLMGRTAEAEKLKLFNQMKNPIEKAETEAALSPAGSAREAAAIAHLDNLYRQKDILTDLIDLADRQATQSAEADVISAQGRKYAAQDIANQMELDKMRVSWADEYTVELRRQAQEIQKTNELLADQESIYSQIIGWQDKAYELKMRLIELEVEKLRDAGIEEAAINDYVTQSTSRAYIERAKAGEDWKQGAIAVLRDMELNTITWGAVTYDTVQATYSAMSTMFSTIFEDAWNGTLKSADKYMRDFAQSILKVFFDMIAQMIARWIMMKTLMGVSSIFGSSGGGVSQSSQFEIGLDTDYSTFGSGIQAPVAHKGGIIGVDNFPTRTIKADSYNNAPRFHTGLYPGEFRAVLEKGEGVFTKNQMKALGRAITNNTSNNTTTNNSSLTVSVPITGANFNSKRMAADLRNEIEEVVQKYVKKNS